MKRSLEDASDRAQGNRRLELVRIPFDHIGFIPQNRGGLGINPHHVHEVGHDGVTNGIKQARYGHVCLVEVLPEKLEEVRAANVKKCAQASPSLAPASTGMWFATLTKHALCSRT